MGNSSRIQFSHSPKCLFPISPKWQSQASACQALAEVQKRDPPPPPPESQSHYHHGSHRQHSHSCTVHTQDFRSENGGQRRPLLPMCFFTEVKEKQLISKNTLTKEISNKELSATKKKLKHWNISFSRSSKEQYTDKD